MTCWCFHPISSHTRGRCLDCILGNIIDPVHRFRPMYDLPPLNPLASRRPTDKRVG